MRLKVGTVLRSLDSEFGELRFTRQSAHHQGHGYYRWVDEDVRESIGLNIRNIAGVVRLDTPHVNLRFDKIENLVARFEEPPSILPLTPGDIAGRETISIFPEPQGVVTGFFRKTWNIWKVNDIEAAVEDFVQHVMKKAQPFWDRYSDPETALNLLLRDDEEAKDFTGADHFSAQRAVAMTFLRRGLAEARKVADAKLPKIRHAPYREEFRGWMMRFFEAQAKLPS